MQTLLRSRPDGTPSPTKSASAAQRRNRSAQLLPNPAAKNLTSTVNARCLVWNPAVIILGNEKADTDMICLLSAATAKKWCYGIAVPTATFKLSFQRLCSINGKLLRWIKSRLIKCCRLEKGQLKIFSITFITKQRKNGNCLEQEKIKLIHTELFGKNMRKEYNELMREVLGATEIHLKDLQAENAQLIWLKVLTLWRKFSEAMINKDFHPWLSESCKDMDFFHFVGVKSLQWHQSRKSTRR